MSRLVKYLFTLSLLFLFFSCSAPEDTIEKKVTVPDKITMLFVTQPSCPSCDDLEKTMTLSKPKKILQNYFNIKKVYLGEKLPDGLVEPNGTPTVYFLGSDNEVLVEAMVGEKKEKQLLEFLEDALLEFKNIYHVDLVKKLKESNRSITLNAT